MTTPIEPQESSVLAPILEDPVKQLRHNYIRSLLEKAKELAETEDRSFKENLLLFRLVVNMGMQWSLQISLRHEIARIILAAKTKGLSNIPLTALKKRS